MSLKELSALDNDGNLTAIGFQMTNFSFDPAHTKSLLISVLFNVSEEMTLFMAYDSLPTPFFSKKAPKDRITAVINNHYLKQFPLLSDHFMAWNFHNLAFSDNITVSEYENECTNFCINTSSSSLLFKINRQINRKLRDSFELNNIIVDDSMEASEKYKEFILCSLLVKTHYPKIGYLIQSQSTPDKSPIVLNDFEGNAIKIQSDSCLYSGITSNWKQALDSSTPFFLYSKKREAKDRVIGTNLTNVTPLQLLLFGCKNAYTDKDIGVELDQKMLININRKVASHILGLRIVIDNLLDSLCCNGKLTSSEEEIRRKLVKLIAKISAI
uniref:HA2 domain-containing protein n=1 Tax=Strongyloides papillosus TaxID=174720 RepID=A0A0N5BNV4_STREA